MPIITRFGGSGGGTPIVCPYPHVWECTVVQSGTVGVVSGVVNLEPYDILHYTMPLGFSTYTLMIGGTTYTTSFLNDGEMYIQWDGNDFVVVSANAGCTLPHVWTSPTYTITGSVLEITGGVDDLRTDDIIVLTLSTGESASVIEYNSITYLIDETIDDSQTNYVQFTGTGFTLINPPSSLISINVYGASYETITINGFTCVTDVDGLGVLNVPGSMIGQSYTPTCSVSGYSNSVTVGLNTYCRPANVGYWFGASGTIAGMQLKPYNNSANYNGILTYNTNDIEITQSGAIYSINVAALTTTSQSLSGFTNIKYMVSGSIDCTGSGQDATVHSCNPLTDSYTYPNPSVAYWNIDEVIRVYAGTSRTLNKDVLTATVYQDGFIGFVIGAYRYQGVIFDLKIDAIWFE